MKVDTNYLVHEGGTKFYETVLITDLSDRSLLIKRWGRIQDKLTGGQLKFHSGRRVTVEGETTKILNEKTTYKSDRSKGKYDITGANFGLHIVLHRDFDLEDVKRVLVAHYAGNNGLEVESVFATFFDYNKVGDQALQDEPMIKVIVPEPLRDSSWGSW